MVAPLLAYADALMATRGLLRSSVDPALPRSIVLRVSEETVAVAVRRDGHHDGRGCAPLNAAAVALSVFVGTEHERQTLGGLAWLVDEAGRYDLPVSAVDAVGKELGTYDARYLGLATRICAELGADIVKTYHATATTRSSRRRWCPWSSRAGNGSTRWWTCWRWRATRSPRAPPASTSGATWQMDDPVATIQARGRPPRARRGRRPRPLRAPRWRPVLPAGSRPWPTTRSGCWSTRAPHSPACFLIHGQQGTRELPYTLIGSQSGQRTVLVDTGFVNDGFSRTLGELDGITLADAPRAVLDRVGVDPGQVDTILLTHAHYDHLGTLDEFPNAVAWLQERELFGWIRALACRWRCSGSRTASTPTTRRTRSS